MSPLADNELFYLCGAMAILGVVTLAVTLRWYWQWRRPTSMSQSEATEWVAALISERIGLAMRAGEIDQTIVDHWQEWPAAYRPALWQIVRQAQLLEETLLHEAYDKGIIPKRVYTKGAFISPPPDEPATPPLETSEIATPHDNVIALPLATRATWINGQLVRTA